MIGISEWWWEWVLKVCSFLVLVSLSRWLSRFYLKSYLVHILLENKIHPIRLLECAKAFPACRGSLTKSLLPFSSTFPLPLARSQIFPSRLSAFVFVRVCVCHWPGLISLMATRLSLCLSICQICQYATFVNMPGLLICHICQFTTFVSRHPGTTHSSCVGCSTMASASTAHGCYSSLAGFVLQFSTSLIIDDWQPIVHQLQMKNSWWSRLCPGSSHQSHLGGSLLEEGTRRPQLWSGGPLLHHLV